MNKAGDPVFRIVVIGVSTGGVKALRVVLENLPADFPLPVLIVQHISPESGDGMARLLDEQCAIRVKEADAGEEIGPAIVYLAPPDYHLLVDAGGILALSVDPPVCYARPSVDVLFESAADVFGPGVIGVILTGANHDGSQGLKAIQRAGGMSIVQDPRDAEADEMPNAAIAATRVEHVLPLGEIAPLLRQLAGRGTLARKRNEHC